MKWLMIISVDTVYALFLDSLHLSQPQFYALLITLPWMSKLDV